MISRSVGKRLCFVWGRFMGVGSRVEESVYVSVACDRWGKNGVASKGVLRGDSRGVKKFSYFPNG